MKAIICTFLFCNTLLAGFSQNLHFNISAGTANYFGDLQSKRFTFQQAKLAIGVGLSYDVSEKVFLRTGFTYGSVAANDKFNPPTAVRNLNFTSSVSELNLMGGYYLLDPYQNSINPYIFAGIAAYHFNPYTKDTSGTKIFLQPLSTEGQGFYQNRKAYALNQFAIPFGAGATLALSDNIHIGIEVGWRKLFTDYLDDVSTTYIDPNLLLANRGPKTLELAYRGNELKNGNPYPLGEIRGGAKYKDWYYFTMFTTSFKLGGDGKNSIKSKVGCPAKVY